MKKGSVRVMFVVLYAPAECIDGQCLEYLLEMIWYYSSWCVKG